MESKGNPLPAANVGGPHGQKDALEGAFFGLLTVLMFAAWIIATRFAASTKLGPFDIAFVRYLSASAILLPFVLRKGLRIRQAGLLGSLLMVCGAGLPFLLVSATGMRYAPASAAGAVMVGSMPIFVALFAAFVGGERFGIIRVLGFVAVAIGIVLFISQSLARLHPGAWMGFALFFSAGALWAGYTLAFRRSGIGPWHAAAIINFSSLVLVAPIYFFAIGSRLSEAPWSDILLQAFMQAVVSAIAGLFFYGQTIRRLGASRAAVITSFTPVAVALMGIPLLGELPTAIGWVGIFLVTAGVAFASAWPSKAAP